MIRSATVLAILLAASAASAQTVSPAERQRLAGLGAALGQCHHGVVAREARTRLSPAQIADHAMAACAPREAPIRAALLRQIGPQRTAAVMQTQRAHWRQAIGRMVAMARGGR